MTTKFMNSTNKWNCEFDRFFWFASDYKAARVDSEVSNKAKFVVVLSIPLLDTLKSVQFGANWDAFTTTTTTTTGIIVN